MSKRSYILACWRPTGSFVLWAREHVHGYDYVVVDETGEVQPDEDRTPFDIGFDADAYTECDLTKAQGDAAIMVARSAASREVWWRYAKRLMEGKVA